MDHLRWGNFGIEPFSNDFSLVRVLVERVGYKCNWNNELSILVNQFLEGSLGSFDGDGTSCKDSITVKANAESGLENQRGNIVVKKESEAIENTIRTLTQ